LKKLYSKRLGEIEEKGFQSALDKFGLGTLISAEPIPHGLFGQNVFLNTTSGPFVFRGCPHGPGQFEYERFMAEKLRAETQAPVPWPYLIDDSSDLFGWPYVIMPRMPGASLESPDVQATLTNDDRIGIAEAMGELLLEIQKLKHPYCGQLDAETLTVVPVGAVYIPPWEKQPIPEKADLLIDRLASSKASYPDWIVSRTHYFLHRAVESNDEANGRMTTTADLKWIESVIENYREALVVPFQPCFVMDDFKEGNTVVSKIDGRWKVTGMFDLGSAYFGDGDADIARLLLMYGMGGPEPGGRPHAFLQAYFRGATAQSARPGFVERVTMYFLMDSVVFWSFFRKLGNYDAFPDFRTWFEPQLGNFRKNLTAIVQSL
jgi:aminoglycoside phosphotransferase (APT) family kinase protein